jgi:hypothetical protein
MAGPAQTRARGQLAGAPIRSAPAARINANKTKEIQAKKLAFPWIPLVESGLFNGLQRIQIKNLLVEIFTKQISIIRFSYAAPDSLRARITRE